MTLPMLATDVGGVIAIIVVVFVVLLVVSCSIKIVRQSEAIIVEKLGTYYTTYHSGVHFVWPIFFRIAQRVSLKEKVGAHCFRNVRKIRNIKTFGDFLAF